MTTAKACAQIKVCGKESSMTLYFVKPSDCIVEVDASNGDVEVILPPLLTTKQAM